MNGSIKRVVLVGAGHAHLYALKRASEFRRRGFELVVIAPEDFWYSGLATGVLGGVYPASLDRIDIDTLLAGTGAVLVRQRMSGLDLANRRVLVEGGPSIDFGALSLNLGSTVPPIPGADDRTFAAKPVSRLIALRTALEDAFLRKTGVPISLAIAGGGVTACEIAASAAELARRHAALASIVVYAAADVLSELPPTAASTVLEYLRRCGVVFRSPARVVQVDDSNLTLADGGREPFDFFVNATGLEPAPMVRCIGLPVTNDGALVVDDRLMSVGADGVFAAGDCIAFRGNSLPRAGVFAIRQSPVLFHNAMAFLDGASLKSFVPRQRYLSIMTLGKGMGFARRSGFWWLGRASFLLKDRIDRRFLQEHRPRVSGRSALSNPSNSKAQPHKSVSQPVAERRRGGATHQ